MANSKKLSEIYTLHYGRVDFLIERFSNGATITKGDNTAFKIEEYAIKLAKKFNVEYDHSYRTQWDGHQFYSEELNSVTACVKELETYVKRFKNILPAIDDDNESL